jgi:EAL domain-containing protein (putative c-di-GMP-specific phosphodiesterase class I)
VFLPVVEFRRLEVDFDLAVIDAIGADMLNNILSPDAGVSINLSSPGLLSHRIQEALISLKAIAGKREIILEVTESVLIHDMDDACRCLRELREHGFKTALDDFGSGFSSLLYLHQLPVDVIKFDRALVISLGSANSGIIDAVARAAAAAGFKLVAEGVETPLQRDAALAAGFTHIQGYLYGKPERPPQPIAPLLLRNAA